MNTNENPLQDVSSLGRVLLVDDSRLSRRMAADALQAAGWAVVEAVDGRQALALATAEPFDCLVTDLLMPGMSGLELLGTLREAGCKLPSVVCSADIQDASRAACFALGAVNFLNKPVKASALVEAVSAAVAVAVGV